MSDQAVRVGERRIWRYVPRRYRLPVSYWAHRLRGKCEPELVHLRRFAGNKGIAVDIGANIGHYSYRLAKIFQTVYAFEIDGDLTANLAAYKSPRIKIMNVGLSSTTEETTLYIPVVGGVECNPFCGHTSRLVVFR